RWYTDADRGALLPLHGSLDVRPRPRRVPDEGRGRGAEAKGSDHALHRAAQGQRAVDRRGAEEDGRRDPEGVRGGDGVRGQLARARDRGSLHARVCYGGRTRTVVLRPEEPVGAELNAGPGAGPRARARSQRVDRGSWLY